LASARTDSVFDENIANIIIKYINNNELLYVTVWNLQFLMQNNYNNFFFIGPSRTAIQQVFVSLLVLPFLLKSLSLFSVFVTRDIVDV